ncbi:Dedicator of cytokinesis protein 3 [Larimichthys crocea]|nr:Dedicator of cytokinesis protein 3 [Larimichthys crocea]
MLVICNFRGSVTQGLALEVGETVQILEKCEGWYRGFSTRRPNVKGVFPAGYVHLKKAIVTNRGPHETVVPLEDPIVTEVTSTLQEWALLWKQLYVLLWNSECLHESLTEDVCRSVTSASSVLVGSWFLRVEDARSKYLQMNLENHHDLQPQFYATNPPNESSKEERKRASSAVHVRTIILKCTCRAARRHFPHSESLQAFSAARLFVGRSRESGDYNVFFTISQVLNLTVSTMSTVSTVSTVQEDTQID